MDEKNSFRINGVCFSSNYNESCAFYLFIQTDKLYINVPNIPKSYSKSFRKRFKGRLYVTKPDLSEIDFKVIIETKNRTGIKVVLNKKNTRVFKSEIDNAGTYKVKFISNGTTYFFQLTIKQDLSD